MAWIKKVLMLYNVVGSKIDRRFSWMIFLAIKWSLIYYGSFFLQCWNSHAISKCGFFHARTATEKEAEGGAVPSTEKSPVKRVLPHWHTWCVVWSGTKWKRHCLHSKSSIKLFAIIACLYDHDYDILSINFLKLSLIFIYR